MAEGMTQVVEHLPTKPQNTEFKPQYCQKKKKKISQLDAYDF
jgi:hypothetical protein